jgi:hypothetical protein
MKLGIIHVSPWRIWRRMLSRRWKPNKRIGIFKNKKGVVPGRWGFYILAARIPGRAGSVAEVA